MEPFAMLEILVIMTVTTIVPGFLWLRLLGYKGDFGGTFAVSSIFGMAAITFVYFIVKSFVSLPEAMFAYFTIVILVAFVLWTRK